jgi:hypothetical protein
MTYDASRGARSMGRGEQAGVKAIDLSLGAGRIGLGSFFNTGSFRNQADARLRRRAATGRLRRLRPGSISV